MIQSSVSAGRRSVCAAILAAALCLVFSGEVFGAVNWTPPAPLNSTATTDSDGDVSPRLAFNGVNTWLAVWVVDNGTDKDIFFSRSINNGTSWSAPAALNTNAATDIGDDLAPQIAWDSAATCVVVWESNDDVHNDGDIGTDGDILFARSIDAGQTWTGPALLNDSGVGDSGPDVSPSIAADGNGNMIVAWSSAAHALGNGFDNDILCVVSADGGSTWTTVAKLDINATGDTGTDLSPHLITDGAGNWLCAWRSDHILGGTTDADFDVLVSRSTNNGSGWTTRLLLNTNASTDTGLDGMPRLETDAQGNWVCVWSSAENLNGTTGTERDILSARSADNGQTWSDPIPLNSDATTDTRADFDPVVRTDRSGNWITVWYSTKGNGATTNTDVDTYYSVSTDLGATWSAISATNTAASTDTANDFSPGIETDRNGLWLSAWESVEASSAKASTDWDLLIAKGAFTGSLAGTIRGAQGGEGLSCAAIFVTSSITERVSASDVNGQYRIDGLPEGEYTVAVFSPGFNGDDSPATIEVNETTTLNFSLTASTQSGGVGGRVTDNSTGQPLLGVRVKASSGETELGVTYTCAEGRFELLGLASKATDVSVEFSADNYETQTTEVSIEPNAVTEQNAVLQPKIGFPGSLAGTITGVDKAGPIQDARITLTGRIDISTTSDAQGIFSLGPLPEGFYAARASAVGYAGQTSSTTIDALGITTLDFALSPQALSGDINGDQGVNAVDVQLVINGALDIPTGFDCDIDSSGEVDAVDIQLVINAALGLKNFEALTAAANPKTDSEATGKAIAPAGTIYWIAGEDSDGNWRNPANWSTAAIPGANDVVVISRPGLILAVRLSGQDTSTDGLYCDEAFTIDDVLFTLNGDSIITGPFTLLPFTDLSVTGSDTIVDVNSAEVSMDDSRIFVSNGARINFPTVTSLADVHLNARSGGTINLPQLADYTLTTGNTICFDVSGAGSQLLVPDLVNLTVGGVGHIISADFGGFIDLSGLATPNVPSKLTYFARAGGAIDLSSLTSSGSSTFDARLGSVFNLPALTTIDGNQISLTDLNSDLQMPGVTSLTDVYITLYGGAILDLSNVTSYTKTTANSNFFAVNGTGTQLKLPNLTTLIIAAGSHGIIADSNGHIDLSGLATPNVLSKLTYYARNGGSIDLTALASTGPGGFDVRSGSTMDLPSLTTLDGHSIYVEGFGTEFNPPAFTTLNNVDIQVHSGAILNFPTVTTYSHNGLGVNLFHATGAGAELNLPNLTSLTVSNGSHGILADSNGTIDLSSLSSPVVLSTLTYYARNGGAIDLAALTSNGDGGFDVRSGSTMSLPSITSLDGNSIYIEGTGTMFQPAAITSLDNVDIQVRSGAIMNLPSITTFTWSAGNVNILYALGSGSELNLPNLTSLTISSGFAGILADSNGHIDLSSLANPTVLSALGYYARNGGSIDLSSLASSPNSEFDVFNASTMSLPSITTLDGDSISVEGSGAQLLPPALTTLTNVAIRVGSAGVFNMPSVTTFNWSGNSLTFLNVNGAGAILNLNGLTTMNVTAGTNTVNASNGGAIGFSQLQTISTLNNSNLNVVANGASSVVDISNLATFDPAHTIFTELNGGVVLTP
jgi:hypothetical protein